MRWGHHRGLEWCMESAELCQGLNVLSHNISEREISIHEARFRARFKIHWPLPWPMSYPPSIKWGSSFFCVILDHTQTQTQTYHMEIVSSLMEVMIFDAIVLPLHVFVRLHLVARMPTVWVCCGKATFWTALWLTLKSSDIRPWNSFSDWQDRYACLTLLHCACVLCFLFSAQVVLCGLLFIFV